MPPKSTPKLPAKKKSPKLVKSKSHPDDADPLSLLRNLTFNGPHKPEYSDWSNQYQYPFLVKPTNFIIGPRKVIVDFHILSVHKKNLSQMWSFVDGI